jgi:hypothetical protein
MVFKALIALDITLAAIVQPDFTVDPVAIAVGRDHVAYRIPRTDAAPADAVRNDGHVA